MNQVQSAVLMLLGVTVIMLLLGWLVWQRRRQPVPASASKMAGENKLPRFSRKSREVEPEIEMMPERLARISGKHLIFEEVEVEAEADEEAATEAAELPHPEMLDALLEAAASDIEEQAAMIIIESDGSAEENAPATFVTPKASVRLEPQIPIDGDGTSDSWLGGRPRLSEGTAWPLIDDEAGDFLAQICCADLPDDLWVDDSPNSGWLALFLHPRREEVQILHVPTLGASMEPPRAIAPADGRLAPYGIAPDSDLMRFVRPAYPEWPVKLVKVEGGDTDTRASGEAKSAPILTQTGFDISDPAYHPFDWDSMLAMLAILEQRIAVIAPNEDSGAAAGTDDGVAAAITMNREAQTRAKEIISIVRETAETEIFSAADAAAVIDALHAIHWTKLSFGAGDNKILPLTEHHPDAELWVHDYQHVHFELAKQIYCTAPSILPAAARALYEPQWQDIAAHRVARIGTADDDPDSVQIILPSSALMNWRFGDEAKLVVTLGKTALAACDFNGVQARICN